MAYDSTQSYVKTRIVDQQSNDLYRAFFKRGFDLALLSVCAIPVLVVLAILTIVVACGGASPFFTQQRIGKNGKNFKMWKFRSMVVNAEQELEIYLAENPVAKAEWTLNQKLKNDPRITKIGRIIRKTSLDELPQLWNVLKGDMSLVGPRPMMREQLGIYPGRAYFSLRPGLSGFWQTSVRNGSSFAERAFYDTQYSHELSFLTDLSVLWRTFGVVFRGTGC